VRIAQLLPRLRGGDAALLGSDGFVRLRVEAEALALGTGVGLAGSVCLYIDYLTFILFLSFSLSWFTLFLVGHDSFDVTCTSVCRG